MGMHIILHLNFLLNQPIKMSVINHNGKNITSSWIYIVYISGIVHASKSRWIDITHAKVDNRGPKPQNTLKEFQWKMIRLLPN